jgi:hypothetical protein
MVTTNMQKEILTVDYNPELDKYYVPSKSRKNKIAKWEVFQSRRTDEWFCNCEDFCINRNYKGECRHIKIAKFYQQNKWNEKYMVIRNRD